MDLLTGFEVVGDRGFYRPSGPVSAGQLADLITAALQRARSAGLCGVLVDVTAVTGFEPPGPAFRRWAVQRWATALGGALRVVLVARPEHICPDRTGLLVAAEEGLRAHICATEAEAVAWLDAVATRADEPSAASTA
ncbi:Uncharacterized protein OS=Pedosphaera parvula (strain Ellin514) GN=Cflav_PD5412 PE=4 SV=1 [Gemmata massiliana]|uniref:STAS/SEC14 domain-containing protein n=1 Tax=Gemmata massiliana TaxID=1210884 RepID=A0A6P2D1P6_9BACT|nr:hypothetical protein [Gemmata massiliana]VTR93310.1 Uncharacterized protein OS=Pedosphaera parvula (strain Ellin514) GN=Cflav_PD5412 PE=4 SV=1 [Gemmata massiliana]